MMKYYCLGFIIDASNRVALVRKKAGPGGQKGKLNGFGGKLKPEEIPTIGMRREWPEESGWTSNPDWQLLTTLGSEHWGWVVHCYWARVQAFQPFCGEEDVEIYHISRVPGPTVSGVRSLLAHLCSKVGYSREAERREEFIDLVQQLIDEGEYPSGGRIAAHMGRKNPSLSGVECLWRRRYLENNGWVLRGNRYVHAGE